MSRKKNSLEIEWLGMDGALVLSYFLVVGIIFYAIFTKNDFIIGKLVPYGIMVAVTGIFIDYLSHVFKFSSKGKGDVEKK